MQVSNRSHPGLLAMLPAVLCAAAVIQASDKLDRQIRMLEVGAAKPKAPVVTEADIGPALTEREITHHVLSRLAFGPRPGQIDQVLEQGFESWAGRQLRPHKIDNSPVESTVQSRWPSLHMSMAEVFAAYRPPYPGRNASRQELIEFQQKMVKMRDQVKRELTESVVYRAVNSERQFEEVIVEFWRNHFNVDQNKDDVGYLANHYEQAVIRKHAFGRFEDFLLATAMHPAMLIYLDNVVSQKPLADREQRLVERYETRSRVPRSVQALARHRGLNENYSRELMELHTVGVDNGYDQGDVVDLARVLTGWSAGWANGTSGDYGFSFRRDVHDFDSKTVMGLRLGRSGGVDDGKLIIRKLANHRRTARFISWKLCRYLIRDEPSEQLVGEIARVFDRTNGNLPKVYEAIIFSDDFLFRQNYRCKFKTPFEFVVSSVRATSADVDKFDGVLGSLSMMGQPIYGCVDPTGYYDQAEAWLDPGVLVNRWVFALRLAGHQLQGVRIPPTFTQPLRGLGAKGLKQTMMAQLLPGGLDPRTDGVINDAVHMASNADQMLGILLGSPAFQQQ